MLDLFANILNLFQHFKKCDRVKHYLGYDLNMFVYKKQLYFSLWYIYIYTRSLLHSLFPETFLPLPF